MGDWGTLYGAAGIIAFKLLFFTLQISLFTRQKFHPKIFLTPLNISTLALILMLIFHVHFPRPLQTVCSNIGGITTPMALIIVGVMLADGNLRRTHQALLTRNIKHDYIERPGGHNHAYWNNSIDYQLLFFHKYFSRSQENKSETN